MTPALSFAAILPRILLGFCLLHFCWNAMDGKSLLVRFFLSAAAGFGVSSLLGFLWIWLGLPLPVYVVLESIAAAALTGWMFYTTRRQWASALRLQNWTEKPNLVWMLILAVSLFLFTLNLMLYGLQYPHGRPDAWINWNVAARFIYLGGADWQATFLRQLDHPDYPLFMAVTNAITWVFLGKTSTWGVVAFHFAISLFTAGLLFSLVNYFRGFKQASLAAVLFMSLPFTVDQGMRQYADLLLACLLLAAGGMTLLYFQTKERRFALLAGFLIGLGGWAKNEGLAAIFGFSLVWLLLGIKKTERMAFRKYAIGLAIPFLIIVVFKLVLAPPNDLLSARDGLLDKVLNVERYLIIFREAGIVLWNLGGTPVSLPGLIILMMVLVGGSRNFPSGMWTIGAVIFLQLAVYFCIYLITPLELTYHLNTSLDRLYLHVFPLALLLFFLWVKSPTET